MERLLQNKWISYIMTVLPDGHLGQLYCGAAIRHREDFLHLRERCCRVFSAVTSDGPDGYSPEYVRQEYPVFGSGDFRQGAVAVLQENGSMLNDFVYRDFFVTDGKPALAGLPATYTEEASEAQTLHILLEDRTASLSMEMFYTIFRDEPVIARSVCIRNTGSRSAYIMRAMSLNLDLPDADYDWIQFSGAWARERHPVVRRLSQGIQAVGSLRGHSSHQHNPFVILKRPHTTESSGEVFGFSFVYSGNFQIQAEVDPFDVTRVQVGIHPQGFRWKLEGGDAFQTPEALIVWSDQGMNGLSRSLHRLYRTRLCRGEWRDRPRPILINSWEAARFDLSEEKLLGMARKAAECGIELFVLDDGWFGARRNECAGLGDWDASEELFPDGLAAFAGRIISMGMKFGLWMEPEMVNPDSDLYRQHPDWILKVPDRRSTLCRHQYVLDFSRKEVVDHIYEKISRLLREVPVSYVKWDMNRSITECYSAALPPDRQGEVYHRQILGVYDLYERLLRDFGHVLFESCAGGGGRFDAGMLYYAPQAWTSDDTDAVERLKIQYGTSYGYPLCSMGSHVSAVPNHQLRRITPLKTRAEAAFFGTYGYELDPGLLSEDEIREVRGYTQFMKEHRELLQFGDFYRLRSPFEGNGAAWMVVSADRREAVVGDYCILNRPNAPFTRLRLQGLAPELQYEVSGYGLHFGDELMSAGILTGGESSAPDDDSSQGDFTSRLYVLKAVIK